MLKLMAQGEDDARQGRLTDQAKVFAALRQRLRDGASSDACRGFQVRLIRPNPVRIWCNAMSESILSISDFKADASRLLDQIRDEPSRIVLTQNGRARAVVEDYAAYQRREQALLMLKLMAQGEDDARQGRLTDQAEVFAAVRQRLRDGSASDA